MAGTGDSTTSVRRALLVGCNYKGTNNPLNGCIDDTKRWNKLLVDCFDFSEDNITILTDEHASGPKRASKDGIKDTLTSLVEKSEPGDILFFQFSGHGSQTPNTSGTDYEPDGLDEVILAADKVHVLDDELRAILSKLQLGVKFTMVCDSCRSGTILDNAELIIDGGTVEGDRSDNGVSKTCGVVADDSKTGLEKFVPGDRLRGIPSKALKNGGQSKTTGNVRASNTTGGGAQTNFEKGMLITGSRPNENSSEVRFVANNESAGLLSFLATELIRDQFAKKKTIMSNRELVLEVNSMIVKYHFTQHVRLEGLRGEADSTFILW